MPSADPAAAVETAMVAVRRRQTRRAFAAETGGDASQQVLDAIEAAGRTPIGVNGIAEALGVDQPRASKLVAAVVSAGLVRREADQQDGRRTHLVLTAAGRDRLTEVHAFRRQRFAAAMRDWSDVERATFATLLTRFVSALDQRPAGGEVRP
ncbi:transcriptional regulator, MarR family [Kribbella flavida DSM 17836]|uniref:Transcriptional regulator, MarR family n=1 Tax=Kribbella flavida (strain DSM 17836 / JCM 10339 / NBRC 14399) TaxID=479435 RepID=D2PQP3_KRIFD|nr:MarR family winged helix-turn-helix transcriptional regulator [Kribbella flavida]ADB29230.1 transcriptional regulator, MarR family [Kribbella flavida DSM 17836]